MYGLTTKILSILSLPSISIHVRVLILIFISSFLTDLAQMPSLVPCLGSLHEILHRTRSTPFSPPMFFWQLLSWLLKQLSRKPSHRIQDQVMDPHNCLFVPLCLFQDPRMESWVKAVLSSWSGLYCQASSSISSGLPCYRMLDFCCCM